MTIRTLTVGVIAVAISGCAVTPTTYTRRQTYTPPTIVRHEVVEEQQEQVQEQRPRDSGTSTYTDSESNGHVVTWETDLDGNKVYTDSVLSHIVGGRYDTDQDTTRTYITAP